MALKEKLLNRKRSLHKASAVVVKNYQVKFPALKKYILKDTNKNQSHLLRLHKTKAKNIMQLLQRKYEEKEIDTEILIGLHRKNLSQVLFIFMLQGQNNSEETILKEWLAISPKFYQVNGRCYHKLKRCLLLKLLSNLFRHITAKNSLKNKHSRESIVNKEKIIKSYKDKIK